MKFRSPVWKKGKTWKRNYIKSKRFDRTCRNHGSCDYCRKNRTFFDRKKRVLVKDDLE